MRVRAALNGFAVTSNAGAGGTRRSDRTFQQLGQHHARVHVLAHIKKLDDCFGKFLVRVESARHAGGPHCWLRSRLRRSRHGCGVDVELRAVHRGLKKPPRNSEITPERLASLYRNDRSRSLKFADSSL